jgi:hypothetical protein
LNPVRWKYLSTIFLIASVAFLALTLALPEVKSQELTSYQGPAVSYGPGNSALDNTSLSGYYIPPVSPGSTITVSFYDFIPKTIDISIFPTNPGDLSPSGSPIYFGNLVTNATYRFTAASGPYGMYVISRNRTSYTLKIGAYYSRYFWIAQYDFIGVIATVSSAILLYYYTFTSKRWVVEQQAIREATEGKPT